MRKDKKLTIDLSRANDVEILTFVLMLEKTLKILSRSKKIQITKKFKKNKKKEKHA